MIDVGKLSLEIVLSASVMHGCHPRNVHYMIDYKTWILAYLFELSKYEFCRIIERYIVKSRRDFNEKNAYSTLIIVELVICLERSTKSTNDIISLALAPDNSSISFATENYRESYSSVNYFLNLRSFSKFENVWKQFFW